MSRNRFSGAAAKLRLDGEICAARALAAGDGLTILAYERLIDAVRRRTGILSWGNTAIFALAMRHADWVAMPETWAPPADGGDRSAFASLARHLFARFAMPPCMTNAWLDAELGERRAEHDWYIGLGRGENIRRVGVRMTITRAMAHRFSSAPAHLSVVGGLRWAQLGVIEASPELTRAVLESSLGRTLDREDFWATVLRFFVNHPELPPENVGPIVDFLRGHELDLRGRTPASLMRLVDDWHRTLEVRRRASISWSAAPFAGLTWRQRVPLQGLQGFQGEEGSEVRVWTITEIRTSGDLVAEGRAMRHCVASYVNRCTSGRCSIWSLQTETPNAKHRALTIEVDHARREVVQARRKCNALPSAEERRVLALWAKRQHLGLVESLK